MSSREKSTLLTEWSETWKLLEATKPIDTEETTMEITGMVTGEVSDPDIVVGVVTPIVLEVTLGMGPEVTEIAFVTAIVVLGEVLSVG